MKSFQIFARLDYVTFTKDLQCVLIQYLFSPRWTGTIDQFSVGCITFETLFDESFVTLFLII